MKAQISFVEFIVTFSIFSVFVAYLFFRVLGFMPAYLNEIRSERVRSEAYQISELLINDPGEPVYWDELPPFPVVPDIMLIIDRSTSMSDSVCGVCTGGLADAKAAAITFANLLDFTEDRSGLVSFGTSATLPIDQSLTFNQASLVLAINNIQDPWPGPLQYTAMGDGIGNATEELVTRGRSQYPPIGLNAIWAEVLLSDGNNNRGRDPIGAAYEANDTNITIYTIGLGSNADGVTLQQIADITGGKYYYAPQPSDLEDIYSEIAREIAARVYRYGLSDIANRTNFLSESKIDVLNYICGIDYSQVKSRLGTGFDFSVLLRTKPAGNVLINCYPPQIIRRGINVTVKRMVAINNGNYSELIVNVW